LLYGLDVKATSDKGEQKAIAEVLSSLDDKIDLLHRQNQTLEALAETHFRHTFIDNAQDDWEEISIKECCQTITKGTTPTTLKKSFVDKGINFIKVNCLSDNGDYLHNKFNFIDHETHDLLSRSQLELEDILYSIAGTIGRTAVVNERILPANVNQALAIIRVNPEILSPVYVRHCLADKNIAHNLHSKIVHAVQPNLSLGEISKTMIPMPPKVILYKFIQIAEELEAKKDKNRAQIQTLENLRNTLLPKLMSGDIRVQYDETSQTEAA
jgi:type I restriction enzyme S subunit